MIEIEPWQVETAEYLVKNPYGYVANMQGTGKTYAAIHAAKAVKAKLVLIVAKPNAHIDVWANSLRNYSGEILRPIADTDFRPTTGWWLVSPSWLRRSSRIMKLYLPWDCVIIDEAHMFKTPSAQMTKAFFGNVLKGRKFTGALGRAKRIWCLSGTPATNSAADFYMPFRVLFPQEIEREDGKILTFNGFQEKFCQRTAGQGGIKYTGVKNGTVLKDMIKKRFFRLTLDDIGIGSKAQYSTFDLNLNWEEGALKHSVDFLNKIQNDDQFLKEYKKVITSEKNHAQAKKAKDFDELSPLQQLGLTKAYASLPFIEKEIKTRKVVIFCQHIITYDAVLKHFKGAAVGINGSVNAAIRGKIVERFQNDPTCRVFVGQLKAASESITLTKADQMWFIECGYVPALVQQAVSRIDRMGQEAEKVDIKFTVSKHPVDRRVANIMLTKAKKLSEMMKGNNLDIKLTKGNKDDN